MSATIINGKAISQKLRDNIKDRVVNLKEQYGIIPGLTVILVGDDPASQIYVRNKEKACIQVGMNSNIIHYDNNITQDQLINTIIKLNDDPNVHGILVQLPLPAHIDPQTVLNTISPTKDVDGFHPINMGNLAIGAKSLEPCTAKGIVHLIKQTDRDIAGKHAVVVGRSNIVGKPVALMLLHNNATVTVCHSKTPNLSHITKQADILVVAIGKPEAIGSEHIKEGAIVIDVGTTRVNDKLYGDVNFGDALAKAGWITPVPNGVGPMTITMLLENTLICAKSNE